MQEKIVLAFLSCDDKEQALSMLRQLTGGPFDIVMLDNGGLTAEQIKDSGYNLQVVQTEENLYWGGGVNALMEWVLENRPNCEAVWVCNDDIQGVSQRMASGLFATLSAHGAAVVSPACDNSNQKSMHRIPGQICEVAMVDFVAPMISTKAWKEIGELDLSIGIGWGLDIDWCYRARQKGYKMFVDSTGEIAHPHPSSTAERLGIVQKHQGDGYKALREKWNEDVLFLMNWRTPDGGISGIKREDNIPSIAVLDERVNKRLLHVCMPSRGAMSVPSHVFLNNFNVWANRSGFGAVHQHIPTNMSVADAREECCLIVDQWLESMPNHEHWILWMDDDMSPPMNAVVELRSAIESAAGKASGIGMISGYCCRKEQHDPGLVFTPKTKTPMLPLVDYTPGEIVEVEWCGLGFVLMKADWIQKLPKPRFPANWGGAEEDHNFTMALRKIGCRPFVHTGIAIGHYSVPEQLAYFPYIQPPIRATNGKSDHAEELV